MNPVQPASSWSAQASTLAPQPSMPGATVIPAPPISLYRLHQHPGTPSHPEDDTATQPGSPAHSVGGDNSFMSPLGVHSKSRLCFQVSQVTFDVNTI